MIIILPSPFSQSCSVAVSLFLQLQESEEQHLQSERHIHEFKNTLSDKEQKLQDLVVELTGTINSKKQLEDHIQR